MRHLLLLTCGVGLIAIGVTSAQVGRGGTQWPAPLADAQRTSWVRTDDKISVQSLGTPGFKLQWSKNLDNQPRGANGLGQGVTASGVTLFVPMSIVTGSSNNVYAIDNDIGYVVWQRRFDAPLPAPTADCPGGLTSGATRIVRLDASAPAGFGGFGGRGSTGYRTLLGEPGQGVPLEGRGGRANVPAPPPPAPAPGAAPPAAGAGRQGAPPAAAPPAQGGRGGQPDRIPGNRTEQAGGGLSRPSGVVYVISSDGMLHVMGLASGKDIQRPAPFVPANSRWSPPVAVDTSLYVATSHGCGGAPSAVWAIDLDSDAKPVTSWKTNGGDIVGAVALGSDGTLFAAIGPGKATPSEGNAGKVNAIVALDPKTLQLKDWFSRTDAEFVTGPTIVRHGGKDVVAAATKDGRILLLDATSLGGANHDTPLLASKPFIRAGAAVSADALAVWQQPAAPTSWLLLPIAGQRPATGAPAAKDAVATGGVLALRIADANGSLSLAPAWASDDHAAPATPLVINGVVFVLEGGGAASASAEARPAILHAYDGATGKRLWNSGKAMTTPASPGSLWTGLGQIYVGARDGTVYAFGFNDERSYTEPSGSR
jgi:outer membrane protein assembly factor BamB